MNLVLYLILWIAIGFFAGVVANWISSSRVWPWFWADLTVGAIGAVAASFFLLNALFGMDTVLSAFSVLTAILGAAACLFLSWLLRKAFKKL